MVIAARDCVANHKYIERYRDIRFAPRFLALEIIGGLVKWLYLYNHFTYFQALRGIILAFDLCKKTFFEFFRLRRFATETIDIENIGLYLNPLACAGRSRVQISVTTCECRASLSPSSSDGYLTSLPPSPSSSDGYLTLVAP